ncbi:MAG: helix-turn-helix domain-containing protein [Isosphaeraceae bacterium]
MNTGEPAFWTIEELGGRVAAALEAGGYGGVASGRVRDVPDPRTIRYYTTLGLLDRPSGFRGRTALYGPRHLRQLVAIKRLQASGLSLADVQKRLAGATDAALAAAAGLEPQDAGRHAPSPPSGRRAGAFWREVPEAEPQTESAPPDPEPVASPDEARALEAVRLGPEGEATLLLATRRPLGPDDLRVVRLAAAPLLELLRLRGLIGPEPAETHELAPKPKGHASRNVSPTGPRTQEEPR